MVVQAMAAKTFWFLFVSLAFSTLSSAACNTHGVFDRSAKKYGLDPVLLYSIALVESQANPSAIATNKNKSIDHGAMQINSVHLPALARFGIHRGDLFNPCVNVDVGAWILRQCFDRWGVTWDGVGCYNSSNQPHRRIYAEKVERKYARLKKHAALLTHRAAKPVAANSSVGGSSARSSGFICANEAGCWVDVSRRIAAAHTSPLSLGVD